MGLRFFKRQANVRVVTVSGKDGKFVTTYPALPESWYVSKAFSRQYTVVFEPLLTRNGPVLETRASFSVIAVFTVIRVLCRSCLLLFVFM